MSGVSLRRATVADVPRLSELVRAAYAHYIDRLDGPPRPMMIENLALYARIGYVEVAP